ncbi:NitT/TauT family transport system permease protein [Tistlia consotensis]|uniref:NitT/TauT family transport system permease protein n=1 Tax=Tistlia consotensis USBA 355 TaxID=560819 RepID=A0A1Y6CK15_9PROT|nr:ABC transporter permease [Tistlia consotensis]SMF60023.1 NitT/TauT family transport system permease protein [Tistlia consotensis USBA 355]SNR94106.1 NitT/TauT family transport system permease protein [Tistlia consotensis]
MRRRRSPGFPWPLLASTLLLLLLWQLLAMALDSRNLPGPAAVAAVLVAQTASGALPYNLAVTLARVAASFFLALTLGVAIGLALGRWRDLDRFFDPWLILFLNVPALVTIILCYVWFGLGEAAAVLAVTLNKVPLVVVTTREGMRALDPGTLEMARVFRFGPWKTLRHVVLPQLAPFLMTAARTGLSLIWKIVLVVELLGRSSGVGFELNLYFQLFDVAAILAYTVAFVAVVQAIELGLLQPLERRVNRWRR